jgi:hypothetical protein
MADNAILFQYTHPIYLWYTVVYMKKQNKKQIVKKSASKDKKNANLTLGTKIGIIAAIVLFLITALVTFNMVKPYPLGDDGRVVYLGKEDGGIYIPGISWAYNSDEYYYGTDMSPEELARYFGGKNDKPRGITEGYLSYDLTLTRNNLDVPITFYEDKNSTYRTPVEWARNTSKKHYFIVGEDFYKDLKQSLENDK